MTEKRAAISLYDGYFLKVRTAEEDGAIEVIHRWYYKR